jgi:stage V sporulation protein D (sporulation-specific penicillin-binding protein)
MTEVDLAVLSFGQNFGITPLQLLTAVSTVANNGNAVIPHVVKEITDKNGSVVHTTQTAATRQVISQETSATIREILESVVTIGTGKNAYIAGYRVAGKTGTSEKVDVGEGAYATSFVAFAPADDPQVAILILLDEPTVQPISGGITVAPIVRRVLSEVLPYLGVEPEYTEAELAQKDVTVPDLTNLSGYDAFNKAKWVGLTTLTQGSGDKVTDQIPAPGSTVSQGSQVILYMGGSKPADTVTVPDLNKMSVQRVKSALADIGLYVKTSGVNSAGTRVVAIKQSVEPGTKVPVGTVITVEFNDLDQTAE